MNSCLRFTDGSGKNKKGRVAKMESKHFSLNSREGLGPCFFHRQWFQPKF